MRKILLLFLASFLAALLLTAPMTLFAKETHGVWAKATRLKKKASLRDIGPFKSSKLTPLHNYFGEFENLYFEGNSKTFFTVSGHLDIDESIRTDDVKGYSWQQYKYPPKFNGAIKEVPGTTILVLERSATPGHSLHFFHFLEHLIGLWNFGGEAYREETFTFILASNGINPPEKWKGENEVTYHLIRALFPMARILPWQEFMAESSGQMLHFERVITSDRSKGRHKVEPYKTDRMLGGYFLHLTPKSLEHMAACVHDYCGIEPGVNTKKTITYIKRVGSRILDPECEKELIERISALPDYEFRVVDFAALSFQEQIQISGTTNILIGVHGNGLSHTLFLPKGSSLIELFPPESFRVEYRIFAKARDFDYFGWVDGSGWISDKAVETHGAHGDVFVGAVHTDVDAIIELLQRIR